MRFAMSRRVANLSFLCRCLSPFVEGAELREQMGAADWEGVVGIANSYFLASALWAGLEQKGLLPEVEPELRGYLRAMYEFNTQRNRELLAQVEEVTALLNEVGLQPLLMKGAAALLSPGPTPGARFMMDLDLWVEPEKIEIAAEALLRAGYGFEKEQHHYTADSHHLPGLLRPGAAGKVELHRRLLSGRGLGKQLAEGVEMEVVALANGARARVMTPVFALLHNIIHSEVSHGAHRLHYLDLRQMTNFAWLMSQHDVEWESLEGLMQSKGLSAVWAAYTHALSGLFAASLPARPTAAARWHFTQRLAFFHLAPRHAWLWKSRAIVLQIAYVFSRGHLDGRYGERWRPIANRMQHLGYLARKYGLQRSRWNYAGRLGSSLRGWSGES